MVSALKSITKLSFQNNSETLVTTKHSILSVTESEQRNQLNSSEVYWWCKSTSTIYRSSKKGNVPIGSLNLIHF